MRKKGKVNKKIPKGELSKFIENNTLFPWEDGDGNLFEMATDTEVWEHFLTILLDFDLPQKKQLELVSEFLSHGLNLRTELEPGHGNMLHYFIESLTKSLWRLNPKELCVDTYFRVRYNERHPFHDNVEEWLCEVCDRQSGHLLDAMLTQSQTLPVYGYGPLKSWINDPNRDGKTLLQLAIEGHAHTAALVLMLHNAGVNQEPFVTSYIPRTMDDETIAAIAENSEKSLLINSLRDFLEMWNQADRHTWILKRLVDIALNLKLTNEDLEEVNHRIVFANVLEKPLVGFTVIQKQIYDCLFYK